MARPESIAPHVIEAGAITPERFEKLYVNRAIPAVLRGLIEEWPAYPKWTPEWFRENHGGVALSVDFGRGDRRPMTLKEYVESFEKFRTSPELCDDSGAVAPYARTWNFVDDLPELCADVRPLEHFNDFFELLPENRQPPFKWLFLGPEGAYTPLHVDVWHTDAWLCNLHGRKKFLLFHPGHRRHIEDEAGFVDVRNPDLERFPHYLRTTPVEVTLEAGETIYIPRKWPHCVLSLTDTVSLTVNFLPKCHRREVLDKAREMAAEAETSPVPRGLDSAAAAAALLQNAAQQQEAPEPGAPAHFGFVAVSVVMYGNRRAGAEAILGRSLRASDNILKFCVHGGELNLKLAASILGIPVEELEERKRQLREEQRAAAEAAVAAAADDSGGESSAEEGERSATARAS